MVCLNLQLGCVSNMKSFSYEIDQSYLNRERQKARELRKSTWWRRKCDKALCYYCGKSVFPKELTMDHVVPISRGGKTTKGNIVTSCKYCNNKKKQLLPMEWKQYINYVK